MPKIGSWRLEETTLYVTLEPCPMCAGAILQSSVPRVVYGARDIKAGCVDSLYRLLNDARFNHECEVTEGILAEECGEILTDFFSALCERKKAEKKARKLAEQGKDSSNEVSYIFSHLKSYFREPRIGQTELAFSFLFYWCSNNFFSTHIWT